jgi:hypothetical protein
MRLQALLAVVGVLGSTEPILAQEHPDPGPLGVQPPAAISVEQVTDSMSVRLFNSVKVLAEDGAGRPMRFVRVLGVWGPHARLDSGALTTQVFIAINDDGYELGVFTLGYLLDPTVRCIVTEEDAPIVYLEYGLPSHRMLARLSVALAALGVSGVSRARC